jgi:hypothetical protein
MSTPLPSTTVIAPKPAKLYTWIWILLGVAVVGDLIWLFACGGLHSSQTTTGTGTHSGTHTGTSINTSTNTSTSSGTNIGTSTSTNTSTSTSTSTGTTTSNDICIFTPQNYRLTSNGVNNPVTVSSTSSQLWTVIQGSTSNFIRLINSATGLYFTARDSSGSFAVIMVATPEAGCDLIHLDTNQVQTTAGLYLAASTDGSNVSQVANINDATFRMANDLACVS